MLGTAALNRWKRSMLVSIFGGTALYLVLLYALGLA